jgi:hypothetical protein
MNIDIQFAMCARLLVCTVLTLKQIIGEYIMALLMTLYKLKALIAAFNMYNSTHSTLVIFNNNNKIHITSLSL